MITTRGVQFMSKSGSTRPQNRVIITVKGQQQQTKKENKQTYEVTKAHSLQTAKFPSDKRELSWMMHLWEKAIKHKKGYNSKHTGNQAYLRIHYPQKEQKSVKKQKIQQDEEVKIFMLIVICKIHWSWQRNLSSNAAISTGSSTCNTNDANQGRQLVSSSTYRARQPNLYHHSTGSTQDRTGISSDAKENMGQHSSDSNKEVSKDGVKMSFKEDAWAIVKIYARYSCEQTDKMSVITGIHTTMKNKNGNNTCIETRMQEKRLHLQFKEL
ncbi:hypothetical protein A4A49_60981, partial [Nicotiana attenuata]